MAVRKRGRRGGQALPRKDEKKPISETRPKETKNKSKKALVVAQEIKIARLLADNDKRVRDKVLKRLNKWLTVRSQSSFGKSTCDLHNRTINVHLNANAGFYSIKMLCRCLSFYSLETM